LNPHPSHSTQNKQGSLGNWNPKVVMFDLDGTLVDTMEHFADLAAELINQYYGVEWQLARRRYLKNCNWDQGAGFLLRGK